MASAEQSPGKICVVCGQDCSGRPRVKDRAGRYYCRECHERQTQQKASAAPVVPSRPIQAAPSRPAPAVPSRPAPAAPARPAKPQPPEPAEPDGGLDLLGDLAGLEQSGQVLDTQVPPCPGCGAPMPPGVIVCTACGYNTQLGRRMQLQVETAAPQAPGARPARAGGGGGSVASAPWLYGLVPAVVLGSLLLLASGNPGMKMVFAGTAGVFGLVVTVFVAIKGFRVGVGSGLLCLICGIYALFFVYSENNDDDRLKYAYPVALAFGVIGNFMSRSGF